MKQIPDDKIITLTGSPWRVQALDDDGRPLWTEESDDRQPEMKDATVTDVLRQIIFSIPRPIQAPNDALHIPAVWMAVEGANGTVDLGDKTYEWLHKLLARQIEPSGDSTWEAQSYGAAFFGLENVAVCLETLKPVDERRTLEELIATLDEE